MGKASRSPEGPPKAPERGETLVETLVALMIMGVFVGTAFLAFQNGLEIAQKHRRSAFLDAALAQARAKIEAEPYVVPAAYTAPAVPPTQFAVEASQLTSNLQQVKVTATYLGATRQVTIFKSPFDVSGQVAAAPGAPGGPGATPSPGATAGTPRITSTPPTAATVGQAYGYQAQATGAVPLTWILLDGPAGLALSPTTGLASWAPDVFGTFGVAIEVRNEFGSDRQSWTIVVDAPPTITTTPVTEGFVGVVYRYQAVAVGTTPITWSLVTGPQGLGIDANSGLVRWDAPVVGTHTVTIRATNSKGFAERTYSLVVVQPSTAVLNVVDGWDSKLQKTLQQANDVNKVTSSDNQRLAVEQGEFISFQFQPLAGATQIFKVAISVEHFEEKEVGQGLILWQVGGGSVQNPTVFASFGPTVLIEAPQEGTQTWDVTSFVDTPAKVNDLKFVVRNNNTQNRKTLLDLVRVTVTYR